MTLLTLLGLKIKFPRILPIERRKAERVRIQETLYLDYVSPVHLNRGKAEGRDLSTRGIRFACSDKYPKGTPLDLTFRFSSEYAKDKTLQGRGIVVRCYRKSFQRRYRIACAFDHPDTLFHNELQDFVSWVKGRNARLPYL